MIPLSELVDPVWLPYVEQQERLILEFCRRRFSLNDLEASGTQQPLKHTEGAPRATDHLGLQQLVEHHDEGCVRHEVGASAPREQFVDQRGATGLIFRRLKKLLDLPFYLLRHLRRIAQIGRS